jgi:transposase-like protein
MSPRKGKVMQKRRAFSAEFKARVVLEVLSGAKNAAEVCREHQLKPQLFASWKAQFLENAPVMRSLQRRRGQARRTAPLFYWRPRLWHEDAELAL